MLDELERIVSSGTKVDIKYYIEEFLDEDRQEEIVEYFREAETPSTEAAMKELGEDEYDEDDVRLVKIQFISDFGN